MLRFTLQSKSQIYSMEKTVMEKGPVSIPETAGQVCRHFNRLHHRHWRFARVAKQQFWVSDHNNSGWRHAGALEGFPPSRFPLLPLLDVLPWPHVRLQPRGLYSFFDRHLLDAWRRLPRRLHILLHLMDIPADGGEIGGIYYLKAAKIH